MRYRGVDIVAAGQYPPSFTLHRFVKRGPIEAFQVTMLTPIDQGQKGWDVAWPGDWIVLDEDCPYSIPREKFERLYQEITSAEGEGS